MEKEKELLEIFKKSKYGDKGAQRKILNHAVEICRPLINSFYPNVKKIGINYGDLEDLVVDTLVTLYEKLDIDNAYDFDNVLKFYYLKTVQSEIRYYSRYNSKIYVPFENEQENLELVIANKRFEGEKESNDVRDLILQDEIYTNTIVDNKAKLTLKERAIVMMFLNSENIKDISIKFKISYQTTYKHIKNALDKIRKFIKINYNDIYKLYES